MPEKELDYEYPNMLKFILAREGGYSNRPNDKGGETYKGITHTTYDSYRRAKGLPKQSVKYMTDDEMQEIYYVNYYKASGADEIENPQLAMYVFDTAVNMGVSIAKLLKKQSGGNIEKFDSLRRQRYDNIIRNDSTQEENRKGWMNRMNHLKDFATTVLPQERELPFQLGVEMNVDQNGNVIYYYDMDDYRYMDSKSFKRNFPKILQQTIHQVGHPTGGAANVSRPEGCAGTYHVSGYVRSDGVKVSDYERTCGAKHAGKQTQRYRGLRVDQMTNEEIDELLDEYI